MGPDCRALPAKWAAASKPCAIPSMPSTPRAGHVYSGCPLGPTPRAGGGTPQPLARGVEGMDGIAHGLLAAAQQLQALLHQSPRTFGHPTSLWTLELAAEVSFAQGLTPQRVSREAIRTALRRLGVSWQRAKRWITSPDPAYARKKKLATA